MPGFTTHYILGMKAYNDLPQTSLKFIIAKYRWLYQLGLQGPDIFFYNLPILRHRDHRNVGSYMHEHRVNDFFRCCFTRLSTINSQYAHSKHTMPAYCECCCLATSLVPRPAHCQQHTARQRGSCGCGSALSAHVPSRVHPHVCRPQQQ